MLDELTKLRPRLNLSNTILNRNDLFVALFNVDKMNETNDKGGEELGNKLLKYAADKLITEFGEGFGVFRSNGATFAILAKYEPSQHKELINKVTVFLNKLKADSDNLKADDLKEMNLYLTMTAGIAYGPRPLNNATYALKQAKNEKKIYELSDDVVSKKLHEESIRKAIEDDCVVPYFQPIVNMKTGKIEKYECLARLIYGGEVLSPYYFIDLSKKLGISHLVTESMIIKSFKIFEDSDFEFSINLANTDLHDPKIKKLLKTMISSSKIGNRTIFELLETEETRESQERTLFMQEMKRLGVKIALDDFGSGYNGVCNLVAMDADIIKIEGELIKNIDIPDNLRAIKIIIEIAKKSGSQTVAEHVSSKKIYDKCKELGIDYAQGYYISEPIPVIENEGLLAYCK